MLIVFEEMHCLMKPQKTRYYFAIEVGLIHHDFLKLDFVAEGILTVKKRIFIHILKIYSYIIF